MKKYCIVLLSFNFLYAQDQQLLNIRILLSQAQTFFNELARKVPRTASESSLLEQIQGGLKLKKTGNDVTGTITSEKKSEGLEGFAGTLSSIIKKESSKEEESSGFDEDPLEDIRSEITAYITLVKNSAINAGQVASNLNSLLALKEKAWKINKKDKEIDFLRSQIQQLIDAFTLLNTLVQRIKKLDTGMKIEDSIASLLEVAQNFDKAKKTLLTKIPDSIKNDLQTKLDAIQSTVKDKLVLKDIEKIRTSFGLSKFKPAVPEKQTKPISKKPELPPKPTEAKKTGSLLPPHTTTPKPGGNFFEETSKKTPLKPIETKSINVINFSNLPAQEKADILNKFNESDFKALNANQLVAIVKEKNDLEGLLNPEIFDFITQEIGNKLKEPSLDAWDKIQLGYWSKG